MQDFGALYTFRRKYPLIDLIGITQYLSMGTLVNNHPIDVKNRNFQYICKVVTPPLLLIIMRLFVYH